MGEHYCDCCGHVHGDLEVYERVTQLEAENAKLKRALEKQALFDEASHKYTGYARHGHGCTRDQLDKGNVCTCGLFAIQLDLLDALADTQED